MYVVGKMIEYIYLLLFLNIRQTEIHKHCSLRKAVAVKLGALPETNTGSHISGCSLIDFKRPYVFNPSSSLEMLDNIVGDWSCIQIAL